MPPGSCLHNGCHLAPSPEQQTQCLLFSLIHRHELTRSNQHISCKGVPPEDTFHRVRGEGSPRSVRRCLWMMASRMPRLSANLPGTATVGGKEGISPQAELRTSGKNFRSNPPPPASSGTESWFRIAHPDGIRPQAHDDRESRLRQLRSTSIWIRW